MSRFYLAEIQCSNSLGENLSKLESNLINWDISVESNPTTAHVLICVMQEPGQAGNAKPSIVPGKQTLLRYFDAPLA